MNVVEVFDEAPLFVRLRSPYIYFYTHSYNNVNTFCFFLYNYFIYYIFFIIKHSKVLLYLKRLYIQVLLNLIDAQICLADCHGV